MLWLQTNDWKIPFGWVQTCLHTALDGCAPYGGRCVRNGLMPVKGRTESGSANPHRPAISACCWAWVVSWPLSPHTHGGLQSESEIHTVTDLPANNPADWTHTHIHTRAQYHCNCPRAGKKGMAGSHNKRDFWHLIQEWLRACETFSSSVWNAYNLTSHAIFAVCGEFNVSVGWQQSYICQNVHHLSILHRMLYPVMRCTRSSISTVSEGNFIYVGVSYKIRNKI